MSHTALAEGIRHLRSKLAAEQRHDSSDEQLLNAFVASHDESAFALLVHRHGPMVLHVCRGVLGHEQDAEDAFQATFLVLARNAATLRKKTALASFLHGTAYRLALSAQRSAARRRKHQIPMQPRPVAQPTDELSWREVRALLDAEIARLSEKYRSVFVLCCLEELSRSEVGKRLGLKERTVLSRLAVARKRLAQRLAHRGVELTAVLTASGVAISSASALPPRLAASTVQAAVATALGERLASALSAPVAELVEGATAVFLSKTKVAVMMVLAVSLLAGAGVWWRGGFQTQSKERQSPETSHSREDNASRLAKREEAKTVEIHGRVLDPDSKPQAKAKLVLLGPNGVTQLGATSEDGQFSVVVPKEEKGELPPALLAHSRDFGLDFVTLAGWDAAKAIELHLVKDQVIRGRVVNTEGKPISGVRVSVSEITVYPHKAFASFFALWQKSPADSALPPDEKTLLPHSFSLLDALTDADGRFVITGAGADRLTELSLRGGGIANMKVRIINRDGFDPKSSLGPAPFANRLLPMPPGSPSAPRMLLRGPNLSVVVEPEKLIRGVVKDADSGKEMPNVAVRLGQRESRGIPFATAKTDAQGRFAFHGAYKEKSYALSVESDSTSGYLPTQISVPDTAGYSPVNTEIRIKKGVIVTGKIIDKATGKLVPGFAQFEVLVNNPFVKDYPHFYAGARNDTAADGTFRVVVIPGPVLLMGGYYPPSKKETNGPVVLMGGYFPPSSMGFDYVEFSKYRPPVADPDYPQYFARLPGTRRSRDVGYLSYGGGIGLIQGGYCKVLDIKPGTEIVHQDLILERASVLEAKIQDADGRPVVGVWATDFATGNYFGPLWIDRAICPVYGLEVRKPRLLIFYEPKKKITGSRKLQGDEKGPITVKLGAMGTIKGRLLDADGKQLVGVVVTADYRESEAAKMYWGIHAAKQIVTDAAGAFTLDDMIPGLEFVLSFQRDKSRFERDPKPAEATIRVNPGERRDLGDIRTKSKQ